MFKYAIALLGLALSTTAFASEFKILNEQKYFSSEGVPQFDGKSTYSEHSFKSKGSAYNLLMKEKILTSSGKLITGVSHDGGEYSAEDVRLLGSIYSSCVSTWKGQIETLNIKAGTFQACKRTTSNLTEWHIEGFPFTVKRILEFTDGSSAVLEAAKVTIAQ